MKLVARHASASTLDGSVPCVNIAGFALVVGLGTAGAAEAALLAFDDIPASDVIRTSLDYQGFNFTSGHFHTFGDGCSRLYPGIANNGTETHVGYESGRGFPIVMTQLDGGTFSLHSLDASEFYGVIVPDRPNAELLRITGYTSLNTLVSHSIYLDGVADGPLGAADFQHFVLPDVFRDLTSLTFTGLLVDGRDGGIALDNIEYNAVPEPGTLALLGMGFCFSRAARRRRTRPATLVTEQIRLAGE